MDSIRKICLKLKTVFVQQNKIQFSAVRLSRLQIICAAISDKPQPARIICWDIAVELCLCSSSRDNRTLLSSKASPFCLSSDVSAPSHTISGMQALLRPVKPSRAVQNWS